MEIDGKSPLIDLGVRVDRLDAQDQQTRRLHKTGRETVASDPDRLELSVRSRKIQDLDELIRSTPEVREALVERVRRSIESGTYNVKAEQVAERILGGNLIDELF